MVTRYAVLASFFALTSFAGETPKALLGTWTAGSISSIQYKNAYTGAPLPTTGNRFAYEFHPDGTYTFSGLMQRTFYNCTTSVFSNESGTYEVDGDSVLLHPQRNPYQMRNSCAPSSNKESEGKLIDRRYQFRIADDENNQRLELLKAGDNEPQRLWREKK